MSEIIIDRIASTFMPQQLGKQLKDYKNILFPYAYNILGSAEDAKDAVQDILTKYITSQNENVDNIKAYLIKSVINRSINIKNRRKRIDYNDVWLPEPIATEQTDTNINMKEILSYSMLILLEKLNAKERAVFILKEAFGYSHSDIAEMLSTTEENSRKLLSRAKTKLGNSVSQDRLTTEETIAPGYLERYIDVIRNRDIDELIKLLSDDITVASDGGGKVRAMRKYVTGKNRASKALFGLYHKFQKSLSAVFTMVNHQPAILFYFQGTLVTCQIYNVNEHDSKIHEVSSILDPDKLKNIEKGVTF